MADEYELWEPATPPDGFAERVVEAWRQSEGAPEVVALETSEPEAAAPVTVREPEVTPRRRVPWGWVAGATAIAAATVLWLARPSGYEATRGQVDLVSRETITLPGRAVMVGEAGSELRWRVDDQGVARIEQDSGSVFYRVDSGPAFDVVTPYGTVEVTGTCFSVEVNPMFKDNPKLTSGLVGAALATAVVVTVYEGRVALADDSASVTVDAGQRAGAGPGHAPHRLDSESASGRGDSPDAAVAKLRADKNEQDRQLKQARQDLAKLADGATEADAEVEAGEAPDPIECAHDSRLPGCSFVDPDPETLREMARCAMVRVDTPSFLLDRDREPRLPPPAVLGLSEQQGQALRDRVMQYRNGYHQQLRDMYVEAGGGSPESAAELPIRALAAVTTDLLDADSMEDERRRVAKERAGLVEPPANLGELSLSQRWVRHVLEVGNGFEAAMAEVTGPETAHAFRLHGDGWPGGKQSYSGKCIDD
ncbi:MAG: FecR domain-containing protein [Myxococcota bacterium]